MPRLIDADALWMVTEGDHEFYERFEIENAPTVDAVPLEDYKSMERTVNKLTKAIADAEPVKHGHWSCKGFEPVRCSVCGITVDSINGIPWAIKSFNYCPHCGAKMDEVKYADT